MREDWEVSDAFTDLAAAVASTLQAKHDSLLRLAEVYAARGEALRARTLVPEIRSYALDAETRKEDAKDVEDAIRRAERVPKNVGSSGTTKKKSNL